MDAYGNPIAGPPLTWSLLNPLAGQISASGVFTTSWKYGQYNGVVKVTSGGKSDTASVLIFPPYKFYLPVIRR